MHEMPKGPGWLHWVDLASPDAATSKSFYCELFGWSVYTLTAPGYGDYNIFTLDDVHGPEVAGMQMLTDDSQPPSWTCYFRVDDLQGTVDTIVSQGGQELVPPTDWAGLADMALCADSQGVDFGIAKPGLIKGLGATNQPSAVCWVELAARDVSEGRRFYTEVFGWRATDRDYSGSVYTTWKVDDWSIGGMALMDDAWPSQYPAQWTPCFWVTDCDATAARATELGAAVGVPPTDIQPGRFSKLTDPTGAPFAVITPVRTPGPDQRSDPGR
ncbi:VOC family protein [Actinomadura napierensis]|uniref:VOC family protein n=2 Tax=Actinomadura napierensis TaxID=267854 RepID=A0ABN2ZSR0_9ACTN